YLVSRALLYGSYGTLDIVLLSHKIHAEPETLVAAALMTLAFGAASARLESGGALAGGLLQAISHATAKAAMFMSAVVFALIELGKITAQLQEIVAPRSRMVLAALGEKPLK